ncbi:MAG: hypothetical protein ACHBN1_35155 [Heteroscytonema crispum UTEX LB 1556]
MTLQEANIWGMVSGLVKKLGTMTTGVRSGATGVGDKGEISEF